MTKVHLERLTDIDMLPAVEHGIERGISHSVLQSTKPNNKYMKR